MIYASDILPARIMPELPPELAQMASERQSRGTAGPIRSPLLSARKTRRPHRQVPCTEWAPDSPSPFLGGRDRGALLFEGGITQQVTDPCEKAFQTSILACELCDFSFTAFHFGSKRVIHI